MNKRYGNLDILKAVCAYMIIVIHFEFPFKYLYVEAITRVAVPIFFMISGFFCKGEGKEIRRKITHLLILFVCSNTIYLIYYLFLYRSWWQYWIRDIINFNSIRCLLLYNYVNLFDASWFMAALIYMYVLYWLICKAKMRKAAYVIAPVILVWLWLYQRVEAIYGITLFDAQPNILRAFPFFIMGAFLKEKLDFVKRMDVRISLVISAIGFFMIGIERYILNRIVYVTKFYIYIGSIFLALGLFMLCIQLKDIQNMPLLSYVGKNLSMYIYILHVLVILIVNRELENKVDYLWICVFSTLVAWIAYLLVEKIKRGRNWRKCQTLQL